MTLALFVIAGLDPAIQLYGFPGLRFAAPGDDRCAEARA
jgi:hypothetical protein